MDGNGRWAKRRWLPRAAGHRAGVSVLTPLLETAGRAGVKTLTLYAFSTENWARPRQLLAMRNWPFPRPRPAPAYTSAPTYLIV
jgi:undecaprenyl diphosphate synthase